MSAKMREALELIAAPMRPDGTWNRDRLACQRLALEALAQQSAPAIPNGWRIERRPDGSIVVQADGIGCAAVHQFADQARQIPEEMLWNLCNAMLAAFTEPRP